MSINFKLFNMERTASNFLRRVMDDNFADLNFIAQPWKHGKPCPPDEFDDLTGMIFTTKNPYANLMSYFRGWQKGHLLKQHYLNNPYKLDKHSDIMPEGVITDITKEEIYSNEEFIKTWCEKYNENMYQYLTLAREYTDECIIVRHKDILDGPENVIRRLGRLYDLELIPEEPTITSKEVGTGARKKGKPFDKTYYTEQRYMNDLTDQHLEILRNHIDWGVAGEYGYKRDIKPATSVKDHTPKIVVYGDWTPFTGFGRVNRGIFTNLPESWEIKVMGINFNPSLPQQDIPNNIDAYSAYSGGTKNPYGMENVLQYLAQTDFDYDVFFALQDGFILSSKIGESKGKDIHLIKEMNRTVKNRNANTVVYTPVDAPRPYVGDWYDPLYRNTDELVFYLDWAQNVVNKYSSINYKENSKVIHHGTDPETYHPMVDRELQQAKRAFDLDNGKFTFLWGGSNQRRKAVPRDVIGAFVKLFQETNRDIELVLKTSRNKENQNGSGWNLDKIIQQYIHDYNLPEDCIRFIGDDRGYLPPEQINMIHNIADAEINTSCEGWGLWTTEAYCTKTPTIVGDHASLSEIGSEGRSKVVTAEDTISNRVWYTSDNSIYRTQIDINEFVTKAKEIMNNDQSEMVNKAYDWALEREWSNVAEEWQELFENQL